LKTKKPFLDPRSKDLQSFRTTFWSQDFRPLTFVFFNLTIESYYPSRSYWQRANDAYAGSRCPSLALERIEVEFELLSCRIRKVKSHTKSQRTCSRESGLFCSGQT